MYVCMWHTRRNVKISGTRIMSDISITSASIMSSSSIPADLKVSESFKVSPSNLNFSPEGGTSK